jgi:hypothetical protein
VFGLRAPPNEHFGYYPTLWTPWCDDRVVEHSVMAEEVPSPAAPADAEPEPMMIPPPAQTEPDESSARAEEQAALRQIGETIRREAADGP